MDAWLNMNVINFENNLLKSNSFVILENNSAIAIDPYCMKCLDLENVEYIFLTHEHYDHISGVNYFKECFPDVKVVCSKICA